MSNKIRARDREAFDFQDGIKAKGNTVAYYLETVTDLKALDISKVQDKEIVELMGFSSIDDGYGCGYRWDPASTAADNNNTVIRPNSNPSTGRWIKVNQLKEDLANATDPEKGAGMMGYSGRTLNMKLGEGVSITDKGASPYPADSTAAFVAAYAQGMPVYVPAGEWFTSDFRRKQLYGPGVVYSNDAVFTDSGARPFTKCPAQTGGEYSIVSTYGNFERAAGHGLIVNKPDARPQISGYASDSEVANYVNRDHVGYYIGMYGPRDQLITTAATTNYTATTIMSPELVSGKNVKIGMFVDTGHSPKYSGKITAVDFASNTATVSGWFQVGNTAVGQVPPSGFKAIFNPADKIWGQNTNVYINAQSTAKTATGYELGFLSDGTQGVPVWGFHAVNANGDVTTYQNAFYASGKWQYGYVATKDVDIGLLHNEPGIAAVACDNLTNAAWPGAVVRLNTNYRGTGKLLDVVSGGVSQWSVGSNGHRSTQRESAVVVSANAALSVNNSNIVLCTNSESITLTLPSGASAGHVIEVSSRGIGNVVLTFSGSTRATLDSTNGKYTKMLFDGNQWLVLFYA